MKALVFGVAVFVVGAAFCPISAPRDRSVEPTPLRMEEPTSVPDTPTAPKPDDTDEPLASIVAEPARPYPEQRVVLRAQINGLDLAPSTECSWFIDGELKSGDSCVLTLKMPQMPPGQALYIEVRVDGPAVDYADLALEAAEPDPLLIVLDVSERTTTPHEGNGSATQLDDLIRMAREALTFKPPPYDYVGLRVFGYTQDVLPACQNTQLLESMAPGSGEKVRDWLEGLPDHAGGEAPLDRAIGEAFCDLREAGYLSGHGDVTPRILVLARGGTTCGGSYTLRDILKLTNCGAGHADLDRLIDEIVISKGEMFVVNAPSPNMPSADSYLAEVSSELRASGANSYYIAPRTQEELDQVIEDIGAINSAYAGSQAIGYKGLSNFLGDQGEKDASVSLEQRQFELVPDLPTYLLEQGVEAQEQDELGVAEELFSQGIRLFPQMPEPYYLRGQINLAQGDEQAALSDLDTVIELNPNFTQAYADRANIYMGLSEYGLALEDADQLVELAPASADALTLRGEVNLLLQNFDGVIADSEQVLELAPESSGAYFLRSNANLQLGNLDEALADAEAAQGLDPENVDISDHIGTVERLIENPDLLPSTSSPPSFRLPPSMRGQTGLQIQPGLLLTSGLQIQPGIQLQPGVQLSTPTPATPVLQSP